MSNPASERPPRQTTTEPFARLKSDGAERRTGPRPRSPSEEELEKLLSGGRAPDATSGSGAPAPLESVRPEALRKPYASLAPGAALSSGDIKPPAVSRAPSVPPGGLWDDVSSHTQTGSKSKPHRAVCPKHKIAKDNQGVCLVCKKEARGAKLRAPEPSTGPNWKGPAAAMIIALLIGVLMAVYL